MKDYLAVISILLILAFFAYVILSLLLAAILADDSIQVEDYLLIDGPKEYTLLGMMLVIWYYPVTLYVRFDRWDRARPKKERKLFTKKVYKYKGDGES